MSLPVLAHVLIQSVVHPDFFQAYYFKSIRIIDITRKIRQNTTKIPTNIYCSTKAHAMERSALIPDIHNKFSVEIDFLFANNATINPMRRKATRKTAIVPSYTFPLNITGINEFLQIPNKNLSSIQSIQSAFLKFFLSSRIARK